MLDNSPLVSYNIFPWALHVQNATFSYFLRYMLSLPVPDSSNLCGAGHPLAPVPDSPLCSQYGPSSHDNYIPVHALDAFSLHCIISFPTLNSTCSCQMLHFSYGRSRMPCEIMYRQTFKVRDSRSRRKLLSSSRRLFRVLHGVHTNRRRVLPQRPPTAQSLLRKEHVFTIPNA